MKVSWIPMGWDGIEKNRILLSLIRRKMKYNKWEAIRIKNYMILYDIM